MDAINIGKAIGTAAVWGAVAGLSYLFQLLGHFDALGAIGLTFVGLIITCRIWDL